MLYAGRSCKGEKLLHKVGHQTLYCRKDSGPSNHFRGLYEHSKAQLYCRMEAFNSTIVESTSGWHPFSMEKITSKESQTSCPNPF